MSITLLLGFAAYAGHGLYRAYKASTLAGDFSFEKFLFALWATGLIFWTSSPYPSLSEAEFAEAQRYSPLPFALLMVWFMGHFVVANAF